MDFYALFFIGYRQLTDDERQKMFDYTKDLWSVFILFFIDNQVHIKISTVWIKPLVKTTCSTFYMSYNVHLVSRYIKQLGSIPTDCSHISCVFI